MVHRFTRRLKLRLIVPRCGGDAVLSNAPRRSQAEVMGQEMENADSRGLDDTRKNILVYSYRKKSSPILHEYLAIRANVLDEFSHQTSMSG